MKYVLAALGKCPLTPGSPSGPPSPAVVSCPRAHAPGAAAKTAACEYEASCSASPAPRPPRGHQPTSHCGLSSTWERSESWTEILSVIAPGGPAPGLVGCFGNRQLLAPKGLV